MGYAETLRDSAAKKLDKEELEWVGRIAQGAERLDQMVHDVLAYSRVAAGPIETQSVSLESLVREIVEANPQFRGRVEMRGELPAVSAHAPSLRQALFNLFGNAVKFVPTGVEPQVRLRSESRDGQVKLWVEDNGIGIAPEQQARIFKAFERVETGYDGTGIGLTIVAKAVQRMHGSIGVESALGKGSRFWLQLPAASEGM